MAQLVLALLSVSADPSSVTVGDIRIQALSPTLIRAEARGPSGGFEDRDTFTASNRYNTFLLNGDPFCVFGGCRLAGGAR